MKKTNKKKLKQFEVEFGSTTYKRYNIKAECLQVAKLIAWEDMSNDNDSSWHWKDNAQLIYSSELGVEGKDNIPF